MTDRYTEINARRAYIAAEKERLESGESDGSLRTLTWLVVGFLLLIGWFWLLREVGFWLATGVVVSGFVAKKLVKRVDRS